jgi:hypothetical protein
MGRGVEGVFEFCYFLFSIYQEPNPTPITTREPKVLIKEELTSKPINLRPTVTERNVTTIITIQIVKFFFDIDIGIVILLHCALCINLKHHT